jgi:hypothetical protein
MELWSGQDGSSINQQQQQSELNVSRALSVFYYFHYPTL